MPKQVRIEFRNLDNVLDGGQEAVIRHPTTSPAERRLVMKKKNPPVSVPIVITIIFFQARSHPLPLLAFELDRGLHAQQLE